MHIIILSIQTESGIVELKLCHNQYADFFVKVPLELSRFLKVHISWYKPSCIDTNNLGKTSLEH